MSARSGAVRIAASVLMVLCAMGGCSRIPADPDGTLQRVSGHTLRVGVSPNPPWTDITGDQPAGVEPDLVRGFAQQIDAAVEWKTGGEEELIADLEHGTLDLVIGGLSDKTPWATKAAITRPYAEATGPYGETEKHVIAAPLGENAFLAALEHFLYAHGSA